MSAAVRTAFSIIALIFFALNCWFVYSIDKLQKVGCKCAEGWRRSFIEFMLAVFIVLFIAGLIFPVGKYMIGILAVVYFALVVAYIVITRQFIDSMHDTNCTCADTNAIWWLGFVNIAQIIFLFMVVLFMLIAILFRGNNERSSARRFYRR